MKIRNTYLIEAKIDDEYNRNYSSIDRDIFNQIVALDPRSKKQGDEVVGIGFGAKQLLLPKYMNGETEFLNDTAGITSALNTYYANIGTYPVEFRNLNNFGSIADFKAFVADPEHANVEAHVEVKDDPITAIYKKYYQPKNISREDFDKIIHLDSQTTEDKIGEVAKNLLLPKFMGGETDIFTSDADLEKIKDAIDRFYNDHESYPEDKQNISGYSSIEEFVNYKPESPILTATGNRIREGVDYELVATSKNYEVFRLLTFKGSETLAHARGADNCWCTAGGSNGHQYSFRTCPQEGGAEVSNYWYDYRYTKNTRMYEFLNKANPTDRTLNFNMSLRNDGVVAEFRDGHNSGTYNNGNSNPRFRSFLASNPDVLKAISKCSDSVLADCYDVRASLDAAKMANEPVVITSKEDLIKMRSDDYSGVVKELNIDIETVPTGLFANYNALEKLTIGPNVHEIKGEAFKNCKSLKTLTLSEGLKIISNEAFAGCESLKGSIKLPNTLEEVRTRAFEGDHCQLKIDRARTSKIKFAKTDEVWVNSHVKGIQVQ